MDQIEMMHKRARGGRHGKPTDILFTMEGFLLALQYYDDSRAARFRMMQASLSAQVTREIAAQQKAEDDARIAELVQSNQTLAQGNQSLTSENRALEEDVKVLEQGVFTYIRTSHGLDPKYNRHRKPANRDAKKINAMLAVLWGKGLLVKRGPSKVTYFRNAECARKGVKLIARM
jgi:hypothetical protein